MRLVSASRTAAVLFGLTGAWMASAAAGGENWPQWRGPNSSGISSESGLPTHWSRDQNVAWQASLAGPGASSPIVWEDQIIVTSQIGVTPPRGGGHPRLAREDSQLAATEDPIGRPPNIDEAGELYLAVESFDRSGERLWIYRVPALGEFPDLHEKHNLATPTPITDGQRIYAWFGNGQIFCLTMEGQLVWERHLGPFRNQWGHGSSPTLHGDLLILLCDHRGDSYLLALDKETGSVRWKAERGAGRVSHSTPLPIQGPLGDELIVNSSERIDAYDPGNGEILWFAGSQRQTPIPSPVFQNGIIFLSRGYRNSDFLAIRPGGRGDVSTSHIRWRTSGGASYVPSILHYQGLLYMTNDVGVVTCADADSGRTLWRLRLNGVFFASPVAADGKVYFSSEEGTTYVLRAGSEPQVLARNPLDERMVASPAISPGRIYLRTDSSLFAIALP